MTVLIDVKPMELLESLIDKERLRQRLAMREAESPGHEPEKGGWTDDPPHEDQR